MRVIGYSIGLFVGGMTLIVVTNTGMPIWLTTVFSATCGAAGLLVVEMVEWVRERIQNDRDSVSI